MGLEKDKIEWNLYKMMIALLRNRVQRRVKYITQVGTGNYEVYYE